MLDAVKNYLNLASGVTEVTRQRAVAAAKALQRRVRRPPSRSRTSPTS